MNKTFDKLSRFLDQEVQLLLKGDLSRLVECEPRRSRLLQDWAAGAPDIQEIERIRSRLNRNITLIEASSEGIRSAIRNVQELRVVSENFVSYAPGKGRVLSRVEGPIRLNRKG